VVELSPFEFLDRLADLVPPPRKHRHRYHGVFAPNHQFKRPATGHLEKLVVLLRRPSLPPSRVQTSAIHP